MMSDRFKLLDYTCQIVEKEKTFVFKQMVL